MSHTAGLLRRGWKSDLVFHAFFHQFVCVAAAALCFNLGLHSLSNLYCNSLIWYTGSKNTILGQKGKKKKLTQTNNLGAGRKKKVILCVHLHLQLHGPILFSFCRYGPSQQQLRGHEESRDWLRSHSTSGLQESASNSPFSPGSSLTSPSGSRFTFGQLGRWPRPLLKPQPPPKKFPLIFLKFVVIFP